MADRVLTTATAKQSIQKMQQIITGPLLEQLSALNREGQTLSEPNNWDGRLAQEFRNQWRETYANLQKTKDNLEELRANIQKINENIMQAGGN